MADTESEKLHFGTEEAVVKISECLKRQSVYLMGARHELMTQTDSRWKVVVPMLWAIQKACGSVYFLSTKEQVIGCVVTSRCILEGSINVAYICGAGEAAAEKANRHAVQKSYRDVRVFSDMKKTFLDEPAPDWSEALDDDEFREIVDEFSTKKGAELPYWTPLSLHDRVDAVERFYGKRPADFFRVCISAIFRHSSELLHGTYYGALFALGQVPTSRGAMSAADVQENNRETISTVVFLMIGIMDQIMHVLDSEASIGETRALSKEALQTVVHGISFASDS